MYPFSLLAIVACLAITARLDRSGNAMRLVLCAWALEMLLIALPLLRFSVAYSPRTDLFVALCLLAQTGGYFFIRRPAIQHVQEATPKAQSDRSTEIYIALGLATLGIVGNLLLLQSADFSFNLLQTADLGEIRAGVFDDLETGRSTLATVGGYLLGASLLSLIGTGYSVSWRRQTLRRLSPPR